MVKYKTVVIDPPWKLEMGSRGNIYGYAVHEDFPYKLMSDHQIANIDIDEYADTDCTLFMWTIQSKLKLALDIEEKWGFKHAQVMVWSKGGGPCVQGIYSNCEFVSVSYRGKYAINGKGDALQMCFEARRGKHSEKPDKFYNMVRAKTPYPRIDIFARRRHNGFDAVGDEVEPDLQTVLV